MIILVNILETMEKKCTMYRLKPCKHMPKNDLMSNYIIFRIGMFKKEIHDLLSNQDNFRYRSVNYKIVERSFWKLQQFEKNDD